MRLAIWLAALGSMAAPTGAAAAAPAADLGVRDRLAGRLGDHGFVDTAARTGGVAFAGRSDGFLTAGTSDDPADVALAYVAAHPAAFGHDRDDLGRLRLRSRYRSLDGVTHLAWSQASRGIESYGSYLLANVAADGRLINVGGGAMPDLELPPGEPALDAAEARAVAGGSGTARLMAYGDAGSTRLVWRVDVTDDLWPTRVVVDAATGDVLERVPLSASANSALVYPLHPDKRVQPTLVNLGADPAWINRSEGGTKLAGNNAHATSFLDFTGDPTEVPQSGGNWSFPIQYFSHEPACEPLGCTWDSDNEFMTRHANRAQTTTQAFWLVNRFHDHLLKAPVGFDEASRNFEFVNSSGQGLGGDAIDVVTLNGVSATLGRFAYAAEGTAPKISTWFSPHRDVNSSDSAELVYHEYTHGLTFRLIGSGSAIPGPAQVQANALSEGWADWYALDLVVAEGLVADGAPDGEVRFVPYLGDEVRLLGVDCPVGSAAAGCSFAQSGAGPGGYTYGDLGDIDASQPGEAHFNGEIWAQTLWDLRARVGVRTARCVVTGGLRLSPDNPDFLQARDAILQSALVVGVAQGPLWEVFAGRGMGVDAESPGTTSLDVTEDFTVPSSLPDPPAPSGSCGSDPPPDGSSGGKPSGGKPGGKGVPAGPTAAQIAAALATDLRGAARALGRLRRAKLLKRKGFTAGGLDALTAGRFALILTARPAGRGARAGARVTIARGTRVARAAGRYSLRARLTRKGARLLRRTRRLRATLTLRFTPAGGRSQSRSRPLRLRR
jgi:hypothetical protein